MITYERALKGILENTHTLPAEEILTEESVGSILKEDIRSKTEMPPFDKSLMDGYAVNALDTEKVPIKLRCLGLIQAGEGFGKRMQRGECVKIMTRAPLPKNTDSVVMVENSRQSGENVEIMKTIKAGTNVCFQGEDIKRGKRVLEKGKKISPSDVAVLTTVGRRFVKVIGKPRVAILNTGGEIVPIGTRLGKNKIYNSIGPMLKVLLASDGIQPQVLGIVKDNAVELKEAIKNGLRADILLISGGVSIGDYDLVPDVLSSLEVKKIFHKVNIKPGKPLFFGIKNRTIVFGIPGNPVPSFLSYLIFVRPAIQKMIGYRNYRPVFKNGIVETEFHAKAGRKQFVLVKISKKADCYYLSPVTSHGSADTLALSKSDGFMVMNEKSSVIKKDSKTQFITWKRI